MRAPVSDKNYVKVFILFLMKNLDRPLDYNMINDVALYDGYVEYIDFATCFAELLDDGLIEEIKGGEGELDTYRITPRGVSVADGLSEDIFAEIRSRSLKTALRLVSFKERDADLDFKKEEIPDSEGGGLLVTCTIREKKRPVCSVSVKVDSPARAEMIRKNFREHPEVIYRGALALLSGDVNLIF